MSFQSSSHFDSTTLLIVKTEIDNTIKNVENGISNLIEDGTLPFDIDDALTNLEQCAYVLELIEQPYIAKTTGLVAKIMKKIMQDSQQSQINPNDVEVMSESTNMIKRYLDFLCVRETRAPQFLVPPMNKLEMALGLPLTREGTFLTPFLETIQPTLTLNEPQQFPPSQYISRLYKLCLLKILQNKAEDIDFKALSLCGNYLDSQAKDTPSSQYWQFVNLALNHLDEMILTEPRLRVLIHLERQSVQFIAAPQQFTASHYDYADVLSLCLSQDSRVTNQLREQLNIDEDVLSDNQLEILSRQLYGPDLSTIHAIVFLLTEQINSVNNKIELDQHLQNQETRQDVYTSLSEAAKILDVINLNDAAQKIELQAERIKNKDRLDDPAHVNELLNSLLFTTNSLQILERSYTPSRLKLRFNNTQITLTKIEEAQRLLTDEARISLQKVIDLLTQYAKSKDHNVIQDVPALLKEVSGALLFLESNKGFEALSKAASIIEQKVLTGEKQLSKEQLQLLANPIISADFFFEQLQNYSPVIEKTMNVGLASIQELEQAVA